MSSSVLSNLKNDFFLQKLFDNLLQKKLLEIIKYNNNLKDRININLNNYKEYSEIYSQIELEIKPANKIYGKFIKINEENKMYYHIYFNDNNIEEIRRNEINKDDKIEKIKIIIDSKVKSLRLLFFYLKFLKDFYCIR